MPTFSRNVASVRILVNTLVTRVVPILIIVALLSPVVFILFSGTAEASGNRPRKAVTAPPSAPPEPFIIGGQKTNPFFAILAVEAFGSITSSILALFADENAEARTSGPKDKGERIKDEDGVSDSSFIPHPSSFALPQPASIVNFDFDNDGRTDIGRWKPATTEFEIDPSGGGANLVYDIGSSTSKFVPGDFNGDSITDAAVFDSGTWTYKTSPTATAINITLGQSGDIPTPADFDGDGITDAAVFRPSSGTWHIRQSSTTNTVSTAFGTTGDVPVVGNYDGDGLADLAVFRPSSGYWHVQGSTAGYSTFPWGVASDVPAPADYDGDGKTDPAVYRGGSGTWYALKSSTGYATHETKVWGSYGDQPLTGDFDDDNKADFAVWRPTTGVWYIAKSSGGHEYHTLGVPGDRAIPSAFIKQIGGEVAPYELAKARLSPKNATGGTDLYSQNFSWGTSLVGLPGRAGLNAGFGMSYNSLVWTKEGSNVHFDTNYDSISPGFRFGFPTIEAPYYIEGGGEGSSYFAYIMVSPSGARTEFRQIAASGTFETADSSYLQLTTNSAPDPNTPVEEIALTVRGTDGTQMEYVWIAGAFRCERILDRNGNYITIDHSEYGQLTKVTDTLGREINVNYSEDLYPTSITQTWKTDNGLGSNVTHTWATFGYANVTLNPTWNGSITSTGPPAGTILKVLEKVTYPDLSSTKFYYNNYGQVSKIENIAADSPSHILNSVRTNLESPGSNLTDVPRLGETRTFVENFNSGQETVVTNTMTTGHQITDITGATVTASLIQVGMTNHPTGNITNTYVGQSGWMESLPIVVNDYADGDYYTPKRSSWTKWTQDDVNSADNQNPRVTETKIGDGVNLKRSTIDYLLYPSTTVSKFGLVSSVSVYDTNQTTVLKRAETDYNLATAYVDRRIIGVPSETRVFGVPTSVGSLELVSRMTYVFDEGDFTQEPNQIISPIRHETVKYDASFIIGRGNMTSTTRHDVTGQTASVTSRVIYDIAGSVVAQLDPLDRKVRIEYTDLFNDGLNRNAFAYPTRVFDPTGNYSEVKYRHDIGSNIRAQSPAPAGQSLGKITERDYDSIGRLSKDKIVNHDGAYRRYEYPTNGIQSKVFSTIIDTNSNNVGDTADEVLSESWSDGAGRVRQSRTEHPGSVGGYSGSLVEYDILGRATRQSVPTEIDNSWDPAGDDATRGFLWTHQKYDWMGRVVRKINTDGADSPTLNDSDILISYDGCGCAGRLVVTVEGELVPRDDQPTLNGRRKQKVYSDILGRDYKTETYNWDGTTVYSTIVNTFNGRNQVTQTRQFAGTTSSGTYQDTTATFDGHGRLKSQHTPQQDAGTSTQYTYNADDRPATVTDARGASRTFTYNALGLATQISYSVPYGSGIAVTPTATFAYDNLGNRTSASNSNATTTYSYDSLSRLTSESQSRYGLTNAFVLNYQYSLTGKLTQMTDGFGGTLIYELDKIGRNTEIDSTGYNESAAPLVTNIRYRSWGALKSEEYRSGKKLDLGYDDRLKLATYEIDAEPGTSYGLIYKSYNYHPDGKLETAATTPNPPWSSDPWFNRSFKYDFAGRLRVSDTAGPYYEESVSYDAFNNMTQTSSRVWSEDPLVQNFSYTNNRNSTFTYDADGRVITDGTIPNQTFDAQGNVVIVASGSQSYSFDADGKRTLYLQDYGSVWSRDFYFYSTVLGGKIVGSMKAHSCCGYTQGVPWEKRRWLYKDGALFATYQSYYESGYNPAQNDYIRFRHEEPSGEYKTSVKADHMTTVNNLPLVEGQIDARGVDIGTFDPRPFTDEEWEEMMQWMDMSGMFFNNNSYCTIDGVWAFQQDCDRAIASVERNLRANGFGSLLTGFWTANIEDNQVTTWEGEDENGNPTGQPTTTNYMPEIRWTFTPGIRLQTRTLSQRQTKDHLTDSQLDKIREQIPNVLTDKCVDFINKLMREHTGNKSFDAKKDLIDTFDYIRKQAPAYGFSWGTGNHAGRKEITLVRPERGFSGVMRGLNILTVVHELIHSAGVNAGKKSSDDDLSQTVDRLGIEVKGPDGKLRKYGPDPKFPNDIGYRWHWAVSMREHCPDVYDPTVF